MNAISQIDTLLATPGSSNAPRPDAEILAACFEAKSLLEAEKAIWPTVRLDDAPNATAEMKAAAAAAYKFWDEVLLTRVESIVDMLIDTRPLTVAGRRAKSEIAYIWLRRKTDGGPVGTEHDEAEPHDMLALSTMRDFLAQATECDSPVYNLACRLPGLISQDDADTLAGHCSVNRFHETERAIMASRPRTFADAAAMMMVALSHIDPFALDECTLENEAEVVEELRKSSAALHAVMRFIVGTAGIDIGKIGVEFYSHATLAPKQIPVEGAIQ